MDPKLNEQPVKRKVRREATPAELLRKYLLSFFWMISVTAVAFILVEGHYLNAAGTMWAILGLAVFQVVLQLLTFMHLDQRGSAIQIIFISLALVIAVVSIVGIILML